MPKTIIGPNRRTYVNYASRRQMGAYEEMVSGVSFREVSQQVTDEKGREFVTVSGFLAQVSNGTVTVGSKNFMTLPTEDGVVSACEDLLAQANAKTKDSGSRVFPLLEAELDDNSEALALLVAFEVNTETMMAVRLLSTEVSLGTVTEGFVNDAKNLIHGTWMKAKVQHISEWSDEEGVPYFVVHAKVAELDPEVGSVGEFYEHDFKVYSTEVADALKKKAQSGDMREVLVTGVEENRHLVLSDTSN